MKELKGTKTEKNLQEAFAGESMARNKYSYWASKAKKDGYVQIAAIFEETAANEKEHDIAQPKGRVNITFCPEVTETDLRQFEQCTNNEYHRLVAQLLDERILSAYQLTPNNYVAHDLRYGQQLYREHYTDEECDTFMTYMEKLNEFDIAELDVLKDIFLGIYSNPVDAKARLKASK